MKIKSSYLGEQEIDPDTIITFPNGVPGFEECKRYKFFNMENVDTIFWLQSLDDDEVMFSAALPETFNVSYEITITDEEMATLEADEPSNIVVMLILSRPQDLSGEAEIQTDAGAGIRANLNSPLLINVEKRLAVQKVLVRTEQLTLIRSVEE